MPTVGSSSQMTQHATATSSQTEACEMIMLLPGDTPMPYGDKREQKGLTDLVSIVHPSTEFHQHESLNLFLRARHTHCTLAKAETMVTFVDT